MWRWIRDQCQVLSAKSRYSNVEKGVHLMPLVYLRVFFASPQFYFVFFMTVSKSGKSSKVFSKVYKAFFATVHCRISGQQFLSLSYKPTCSFLTESNIHLHNSSLQRRIAWNGHKGACSHQLVQLFRAPLHDHTFHKYDPLFVHLAFSSPPIWL